MKKFLALILGVSAILPLHAEVNGAAKKQPEAGARPGLPAGGEIIGEYSIVFDEEKEVLRYTGLFTAKFGDRSFTSLDKKGTMAIHPDGTFTFGKSTWKSLLQVKRARAGGGPPKPISLTGTYSLTYDSKTGEIVCRGLATLAQGESKLTSLEEKNSLTIFRNGKFHASKGRWSTIARDPNLKRPLKVPLKKRAP